MPEGPCTEEHPNQESDDGHDFSWCCGYSNGEGDNEKGFCCWCGLEAKERCPGVRYGDPGCRDPEAVPLPVTAELGSR